MKTIGVKKNEMEYLRSDGYIYAYDKKDYSRVIILNIPENDIYATQIAKEINKGIFEITFGYLHRDFAYDLSNEIENNLISGEYLSDIEIIKSIINYVYLYRPKLMTSTLAGFRYDGIAEEDRYKHNPNEMNSSLFLSDGNIYKIKIYKGKLEIKRKGSDNPILENFELDKEIYNKSLKLMKLQYTYTKSCNDLNTCLHISDFKDKEKIINEFIKLKKEIFNNLIKLDKEI